MLILAKKYQTSALKWFDDVVINLAVNKTKQSKELKNVLKQLWISQEPNGFKGTSDSFQLSNKMR